MNPLSGLRVLELATEIAGPYCGKLLADAGADVVKAEPAGGDPLRRWSAGGPPPEGDGALFQYLNAAKRSVLGDTDELCAAADIVTTDRGTSAEEIERLRLLNPDAVVVSITPFGRTGPWADLPATEFTLQAWCGSSAGRGLPGAEGRPLHAGGRLGEWIGGSFAAVAALAATRTGRGEHIDVSLLECMTMTMGGFSVVVPQVLGAHVRSGRSLELPSIEPTADGYVGFCTITAQQFQDFLVLIERFDWLDDPRFASLAYRQSRRAEFQAAVRAWTAKRTTAEIVELASALRVPAVPIGAPDTITAVSQFRERRVFQDTPGGFLRPRPPYRIGDFTGRPPAPAPTTGEHTGSIGWSPRTDRAPGRAGLPLAGVRIMDFTAFWAGPTATAVLSGLGADVIKVEGIKRPDGLRYAGGRPPTEDDWWETAPIFLAINPNKRDLTLELSTPEGQAVARRLVARSDVVIENFSPRVMPNLDLDWETVHSINPGALMVRMPAFGLDGPWRDRVGFAQTMEQLSGMAWLTGEADGEPVIPRGACDPIAGLHAAFATLVALAERTRTGTGMLVEAPMVEAVLNVAAEVVIERSAYGRRLMRAGNRGPVAAPQGIYRCAGDDRWAAVAVRDDTEWTSLCAALGDDELPRSDHDLTDAVLGRWCAEREPAQVVDELRRRGVPVAEVVLAADLLGNPQLRARGWFEEIDHPVVGRTLMPSMPFRFESRPGGWLRSAAPTLGQHNEEILRDVLDLTDDEVAGLRKAKVIGTRPAGL